MSRERIRRREFLQIGGMGAASVLFGGGLAGCSTGQSGPPSVLKRKPNVVFIFADQWRAQAAGYAGNRDVRTPNLDKLAGQGVNFSNAVSCCPVCSPLRASLMTGRYPLSHGVFLNDVRLSNEAVSVAQAFGAAGYKTGYIGKWHLDGNSRTAFIPRERRQGFEFWKAFGCTHNYNNSFYYGDENVRLNGKATTQSPRRGKPSDISASTQPAGPSCFLSRGGRLTHPIIRRRKSTNECSNRSS